MQQEMAHSPTCGRIGGHLAVVGRGLGRRSLEYFVHRRSIRGLSSTCRWSSHRTQEEYPGSVGRRRVLGRSSHLFRTSCGSKPGMGEGSPRSVGRRRARKCVSVSDWYSADSSSAEVLVVGVRRSRLPSSSWSSVVGVRSIISYFISVLVVPHLGLLQQYVWSWSSD